METLIRGAFGIEPYQLDGPDWIYLERYAVNAKLPSGATAEQFRQMMVNLLVERFGLFFHRVTREFPAYAITVAKGGPKLTPTTHNDPFGKFQCSSSDLKSMKCELTQTSIGVLTNRISGLLRKPGTQAAPVVDHTGISGKFDFNLEFPVIASTSDLADIAANLSDALRKAGLQLDSIKLSLPVFVIDHLERNPTPN